MIVLVIGCGIEQEKEEEKEEKKKKEYEEFRVVDAHFFPKSKTTQSKVSIFNIKPKHGPNPISLLQTKTSSLGCW